ncbi:MAG TPA: hypothetical protein ENF21_03045 [Bacteroidetes bacterium]|nr:hypothetical protein [Bacteroidota bacterium]
MKAHILRISCLSFFISFLAPAGAQETDPVISGEWLTDQRLLLHDPYPWSWSENRLDLGLKKSFHDKVSFSANVWFRSFGFPFLTGTSQLFNKDETSPYQIDFREAWLDLYGFIFPDLDVRIGRQVITWGRGDRLNPTRNLNPLDLEDIWDFGRSHGVEAVKLDYYLNDFFFLEGVYVPFFRPATLPRGDLASVFSTPISLPVPSTQIAVMTDTLLMPDNRPGQSSSYGVKLGGFLMGFDFSLSYSFFRDGLPIPSHTGIAFADEEFNLAVNTELLFPRFHAVGADMAGSLAGVGIWGEMALMIPDKEVIMHIDLSEIGYSDLESIQLEDKPYFRYLLGADYTFTDGSYMNFQFLHGFFHEKGKGNLNDYFLLGYEKNVAQEKIVLKPVTGAVVIGDWKNIKEDHALVWMPSVGYLPDENTEITLGIRLISGKGETAFAGLDRRDECFVSIRHNF